MLDTITLIVANFQGVYASKVRLLDANVDLLESFFGGFFMVIFTFVLQSLLGNDCDDTLIGLFAMLFEV